MGHAPGGHAPQARISRERRIRRRAARFARSSLSPYSGSRCASGLRIAAARKRILKDIPPLHFGEGRECTLPACIAVATGADYDWVMGASGAAFTTTIDEQAWSPSGAAPLDDETLARASAALGLRPDRVVPPFDDEMKQLIFERISEAVDAKVPPLVRGLVQPHEFGLLVGYDEEGPNFWARTYFDRDDKPTKVDWSAFKDEAVSRSGELVFLDQRQPPERPAVVRDAIDVALASAKPNEAATEAWIEGLQNDAEWAKHPGEVAFADHTMRTILHDKRRSAAGFLRSARTLFSNALGADLLRAAEAYGFVGDLAEKFGVKPFSPGVATRFADPGQRRAWVKALTAAIVHERDAHAALASARAAMK